MSERFNGWANYATWNVSLWIGNDEGLYGIALECEDYAHFQEVMADLESEMTLDGVMWDDRSLDHNELDEMIEELKND